MAYTQWYVQGRFALCLARIFPSISTSQTHTDDGKYCKQTKPTCDGCKATHTHTAAMSTHIPSARRSRIHTCVHSDARNSLYPPCRRPLDCPPVHACLTPARPRPSPDSRPRHRPRALESSPVCAADELLNKSSAGRPRRLNLTCTPSWACIGRRVMGVPFWSPLKIELGWRWRESSGWDELWVPLCNVKRVFLSSFSIESRLVPQRKRPGLGGFSRTRLQLLDFLFFFAKGPSTSKVLFSLIIPLFFSHSIMPPTQINPAPGRDVHPITLI